MGKPEKIECPIELRLLQLRWRFPELNQRRFVWVNGQSKTAKPFWQDLHNFTSLPFVLKADNEVIGKPNHEAAPTHSWLDIFYKPVIQYMMKEDVCQ
jgi:hypothetical protein